MNPCVTSLPFKLLHLVAAVLCIGLAGLTRKAIAEPLVKVGAEVQLNSQTTKSQFLPNVDSNARGVFACTWTDDTNIKVRAFKADGRPKTPEILANTTT